MANAIKGIVAELNKNIKFDGNNDAIWQQKVQFIIMEQELLNTLTTMIEEPNENFTDEEKRVYEAFKKKDILARVTLLSTIIDELMVDFSMLESAKAIWDMVKNKFGVVSMEKQRSTIFKFENYMKRSDHNMSRYLCEMSRIISNLWSSGHTFTDE